MNDRPQVTSFQFGISNFPWFLPKRWVNSALFFLHVSYFDLVSNVGQSVSCYFVKEYPWMETCFETNILALSVFFFLIFVIGIPAFFGYFLKRHATDIKLAEPEVSEWLGFFYSGYQTKYYYWGEVTFLLRFLVAGIFLSLRHSRVGFVLVSLVIVIQIVILLWVHPSRKRSFLIFEVSTYASLLVGFIAASRGVVWLVAVVAVLPVVILAMSVVYHKFMKRGIEMI